MKFISWLSFKIFSTSKTRQLNLRFPDVFANIPWMTSSLKNSSDFIFRFRSKSNLNQIEIWWSLFFEGLFHDEYFLGRFFSRVCSWGVTIFQGAYFLMDFALKPTGFGIHFFKLLSL